MVNGQKMSDYLTRSHIGLHYRYETTTQEIFMIQLDPQWIALKAQCNSPYLTKVYDNLTLQLLNGYCGTLVAIESFYKAIQNQ